MPGGTNKLKKLNNPNYIASVVATLLAIGTISVFDLFSGDWMGKLVSSRGVTRLTELSFCSQ